MSNKRSNSFRQAILQGNRRLSSKALLEEKGLSLSQRLIRHVAYETLPREIDRKWYYDSYTCCPPPWFMITVTLLEARTRVERGRGGSLNLGSHGERRAEVRGGKAADQIVLQVRALLGNPGAAKKLQSLGGLFVCFWLCVFMCVCVCSRACTCVCPMRPEAGVRSLGCGITGHYLVWVLAPQLLFSGRTASAPNC